MAVVNFVLGDFSSLRVGCSPDGSTLDVGTPKADGPCFAPVISPKILIDVRSSTKLTQDDNECMLKQATGCHIRNQSRERSIELTELFQVEIEVLVVGVVIRVGDLNKRDSTLK